MTITYLLRSPGTGHSIEELFGTVQRAVTQQPDIHTRRIVLPRISRGWRSVWQNLRFIRTLSSDIFHITGDVHYLALMLPGARTVLTIHDCSTLRKNRNRPLRFALFWLFWYYLPIRRAGAVTTVSEKTRQELIHYAGRVAKKAVVVTNGYDPAFLPQPGRDQFIHPILLQVGTARNKNLPRLIAALEGIPCTLLLVGPLSKTLRKALRRHAIDYRNFVDLSRTETIQLYTDCDIVTFVSTYEGFGMPVLEANAVGRVVLTSAIDPMRTLAAGSAHLVDPTDTAAIRAGVLRLINDGVYRQQLIQAGFLNAQRYTAAAAASQYGNLYRNMPVAHPSLRSVP